MTNTTMLTMTVLAVALMGTGGAADEAHQQPADHPKCAACERECPACAESVCREQCAEEGEQPDATVSTLLQLRELFGNPFAGTALAECADESQFAAALSQVAQQPMAYAPAPPLPPPPAAVAYSPHLQLPPPPHLPPGTTVHVRAVAVGSSSTVQVLRNSARQLESVANDLEELGKYDEADGLREVVNRLRHQAREAASVAQHPVEIHHW